MRTKRSNFVHSVLGLTILMEKARGLLERSVRKRYMKDSMGLIKQLSKNVQLFNNNRGRMLRDKPSLRVLLSQILEKRRD